MKTFIKTFVFTFSIGLIIACTDQSTEGIKVSGKVNQPISGEWLKIESLNGAQIQIEDSVEVDADGEFVAYVAVSQPTFFRFNFFDRQYVNIILNGSEKGVEIEVDGDRPDGLSKVSGSTDTELLEIINEAQDKRKSDESLLNQEAIQARMNGDTKGFNEIVDQYIAIDAKNQAILKEVVWEAAPSLAAIFGVNYLDLEANLGFIDSLALKFEQTLPDHPLTLDLISRVGEFKKLAVGADAPDIELPDPEGNMVSLSSLKGNYVLIDFWAAWCRPCRVENPNVVRLYNKYGDQNFEILGVSLDRTKQAWLKAIEDDGLAWKHISDLKYFNSEAARKYRVDAIPATYLIGPDGKIVAKGLRGPSLESKLAEIFG